MSGFIFRDGTTDVTRTMHFGTPTDKQKVRKSYYLLHIHRIYQQECFTLVLKGNIALCTAIFPEKTPGA